MRGRQYFDTFASEVLSNAQATIPHSGKISFDKFGAKVRNVDPQAAIGRAAAGDYFEVRSPRNQVAGGTLLSFRVVTLHVTFAEAVKEMGAGAPQSLFQQG